VSRLGGFVSECCRPLRQISEEMEPVLEERGQPPSWGLYQRYADPVLGAEGGVGRLKSMIMKLLIQGYGGKYVLHATYEDARDLWTLPAS
jgi:hypothetical protein